MTAIRKTPDVTYSKQELQVLLTGIPLHATSTRFGHPIYGGWRIEEITTAWALLKDELMLQWETESRFRWEREHGYLPFGEAVTRYPDKFAQRSKAGSSPFAMRLSDGRDS